MKPERDLSQDADQEVRDEAPELAGEVIRRMLVWIAHAPTMLDRGLRATVALHCCDPILSRLQPSIASAMKQHGRRNTPMRSQNNSRC